MIAPGDELLSSVNRALLAARRQEARRVLVDPILSRHRVNDPKYRAFLGEYIAANMATGLWYGTKRLDSDHPCSSSTENGLCWLIHFSQSYSVTSEYCASEDARDDGERCVMGGHVGASDPRREPPRYCYGYDDFARYVLDCEAPYVDWSSE
jgi:hypothetical protein